MISLITASSRERVSPRGEHARGGTNDAIVELDLEALRCGSTPPPRLLQISSPGGWECYLEDLFEAGPSALTDGALDPVKINPIAAKYDIRYEETAARRA